jgi:hypothetical protein
MRPDPKRARICLALMRRESWTEEEKRPTAGTMARTGRNREWTAGDWTAGRERAQVTANASL